jgi:tRNA 2-thiouridine synthesizing protein A
MSKNILDCRGLSCPLPVIRVKERVEQSGVPFAVLVEPGIAVENIKRFLGQRGISCTMSSQPDGTLIEIMETST